MGRAVERSNTVVGPTTYRRRARRDISAWLSIGAAVTGLLALPTLAASRKTENATQRTLSIAGRTLDVLVTASVDRHVVSVSARRGSHELWTATERVNEGRHELESAGPIATGAYAGTDLGSKRILGGQLPDGAQAAYLVGKSGRRYPAQEAHGAWIGVAPKSERPRVGFIAGR